MNAKIFGIVRHILTFGGGIVVAKGYIDEQTMLQIVAAIVSLAGVVWSVNSPEKTTP
jgi:hypothetical protein